TATCKCGSCTITVPNPTEAIEPGYCHCNSARQNYIVTGPTTEYHSYKGDWNTYRVRCTDCGTPCTYTRAGLWMFGMGC
ncbi:hypothetical protein BCR33DRAFT_724259, partial [Rhizoclosmatium globosum]